MNVYIKKPLAYSLDVKNLKLFKVPTLIQFSTYEFWKHKQSKYNFNC